MPNLIAVRLLCLSLICLLMASCASKGAVSDLDTSVTMTNSRLDQINARMDEINTTMARIEENQKKIMQVSDQIASISENSEIWTNYADSYAKAQKAISDLQSQLSDKVSGIEGDVRTLKTNHEQRLSELKKGQSDLQQDLELSRSTFNRRIDNTNTDITSFRQQTSDKFSDISRTLSMFGSGVLDVLRMQNTQFRDVSDTYEKSIGEIEPRMPESQLSTFKPEELKPSQNPESTSGDSSSQ